jgi:hypothetical protein
MGIKAEILHQGSRIQSALKKPYPSVSDLSQVCHNKVAGIAKNIQRRIFLYFPQKLCIWA